MIDKEPTINELALECFMRRVRETSLGGGLAKVMRGTNPAAFAMLMDLIAAAYHDGFHDGIEYHEVHRT